MLITRTHEIDMGHRIPNHKSKCRNLHGHRYIVEVGVNDRIVTTPGASDEGMVIDFGDVKGILETVLDGKYDHGFMMYKGDELVRFFEEFRTQKGLKVILTDFIPTVENIAKQFFYDLDWALNTKQINLQYVKVWETTNSAAVYTRNDRRMEGVSNEN